MTERPAGIGVKTLDHVTLIVKDLQRSRDFYCGLLGMREVERPAFSFAGKWFQAGNTQVHLILEHAESGPAGVSGSTPSSRYQHFAFEIDDADAAVEALRSRSVRIVSGPQERPDGAIQLFVQDPDGHLVELCQPRR